MIAREVYELSLAFVDAIEKDGSIKPSKTADYAARAPKMLSALQRELAFYEGIEIESDIESLDDSLQISDDTAKRVMFYGLAAAFALADLEMEKYNDYSAMYRSLIRTIRHDEEDINDEYQFLAGMR